MTKPLFYRRLLYGAGAVGLASGLASTITPHPVSAQGVSDTVRGLNSVINPGDAQRLEDQARRSNQPAEERYWRDYRTGLETPDRNRGAIMAVVASIRTTRAVSAPTLR